MSSLYRFLAAYHERGKKTEREISGNCGGMMLMMIGGEGLLGAYVVRIRAMGVVGCRQRVWARCGGWVFARSSSNRDRSDLV